MLVNCPTCQATVDVGPLEPGTTASCPFCQGLFQVPSAPPAAAVADPVIMHNVAQPAVGLEASSLEPSSSIGLILLLLTAFALIGAGSGYLAFQLFQSEKKVVPAAAPKRAEAAETETDRVASWRMLGHWRGAGQQRTPAIRTTSSRLRVLWSAKPRDPQIADNFAIHLIDGAGRQLHTPVSIVGAGSDTAYVSAKPGRYMLEILAFDTEWEVTVEEPE